MDQHRIEQIREIRAHAAALWQKARVRAARVPVKAWFVLGLFLLSAVLMAAYTAFAGRDASLRLKVQHSLRSAQLSVWVDGDLAYSGKLTGSARKKFGLIPDSMQGSLSETLPVSSGTHQVRVRVASDDGTRTPSAASLPATASTPCTCSPAATISRWAGKARPPRWLSPLPPAPDSSAAIPDRCC